MHKQIGVVALAITLAIALTGCGTTPGTINGFWTATLTNPAGTPALAFQTTFLQGGGTGLTISNFAFTTSGSCFVSGQTSETGSVSLGGNYNGKVTGSLAMIVTSTVPNANNLLNLKGTVNGGTITGTWTLTGGTGCTGNGTFIATSTRSV